LNLKLSILALTLLAVAGCSVTPTPQASRGLVDATTWHFDHERLALEGEWAFYNAQLVEPRDEEQTAEFRRFPEIWNTGKFDQNTTHYATYQLQVTVPDIDSLAITIPQIYCSYRLWINQELVTTNGIPGTTKKTTQPQWLPSTVHFPVTTDTLLVTLQIANFYHSKGGVRENLYLGSTDLLDHHRQIAVTGMWIESMVLACLGLFFGVLFFIRRQSVVLYLALACLVWSVRALFSNLYLIIDQFPTFNWFLMIRIEYLTIFLTMAFMLLYIMRLFPKESVKVLFGLLLGANICFILPTILAEPLVFTRYLPVYLFTAGATILLGAATVLLAWINDRPGTAYMLVASLLTAMIFSYDILSYEVLFLFNELFISIGYTIVFIFLGLALLAKMSFLHTNATNNTLTFEQMVSKR
jgi:hypothetical protein